MSTIKKWNVFLQELPHLRVLDLSHNKITCLQDLHTRLGNITKLALASNNIVKLNGEVCV